MPFYAYRCSACGHAKDVLQKMSDPLLHTCPACGGETFTKQLTAAGFQLKGTGWYATDFKGGPAPAASAGADEGGDKAKPADAAANSGASAPASPAAGPAGASAPVAAPATSTSPPPDGGRSSGGAAASAPQGASGSSAGH